MSSRITRSICVALVLVTPAAIGAQHPAATAAGAVAAAPAGADLPRDFVIGIDDVLEVMFWRDADLTREVVVRPDGKISLQLLNEIQAAGLTPDELRAAIMTEARHFMEDPNVTVLVKQINSRKVFITGQVSRPGAYPLSSSMTVLQLISLSGGLREFAKGRDIVVMRTEAGAAPLAYQFDYEDILKGRRLAQNIVLKPGDTVVVP